jgi:hypothetical protein
VGGGMGGSRPLANNTAIKIFLWAIITASVIGGFIGGEVMDRAFSPMGAIIGGAGIAVLLFSLGALFHAQDKKKREEEIPPEIRKVFDRMISSKITGSVDSSSRAEEDKKSFYLTTAAKLLSIQFIPKYKSASAAFKDLHHNKLASGYILGFHDALIQRLKPFEPNSEELSTYLLDDSYHNIFGAPYGLALIAEAQINQTDPAFNKGRMIGRNDLINFFDNRVPPFGLNRILMFESISREMPGAAASASANRVACPDNNCIGIIGPDGKCTECGKPLGGGH